MKVLAQETASQRSSARTLTAVSGELQVLLTIEDLVDLEALKGRLEGLGA